MPSWMEHKEFQQRDAEYARHDDLLDALEKGRAEWDEREARDALYGEKSGTVEPSPVERPGRAA